MMKPIIAAMSMGNCVHMYRVLSTSILERERHLGCTREVGRNNVGDVVHSVILDGSTVNNWLFYQAIGGDVDIEARDIFETVDNFLLVESPAWWYLCKGVSEYVSSVLSGVGVGNL